MSEYFAKNKASETACVLGLPYFGGSALDAVRICERAALSRTPTAVFTPGATLAARAERDAAFLALLQRADLLLPDGRGCLLAARLCGSSLRMSLAGIDLAEAVFRVTESLSPRVFFYGARPGVAERAAAHMRARYPGLILSAVDGYGADPVARIAAFCPHIVCVCLGAGKQEAWIDQNKTRVGGLLLGLGGAFDVWAGDKRRAPRCFRRAGLEWAWRTALEPRRFVRLLPLPAYFWKCLRVGQNAKKSKENAPSV